jgi:hypothetical protein
MDKGNMDENELGDIFWDIPTWVYYVAQYDLGCTIYIANNTDVAREYTLITRTYKEGILRSEGVLSVYGYTWFTVEPGDFIKLCGTMVNEESDVVLTVILVEKESQEAADSVSTTLVTPSTAALPPGWNLIGGGTDWLSLLMMVMVMVMMMKMMSSAIEPKEKKQLGTQGS